MVSHACMTPAADPVLNCGVHAATNPACLQRIKPINGSFIYDIKYIAMDARYGPQVGYDGLTSLVTLATGLYYVNTRPATESDEWVAVTYELDTAYSDIVGIRVWSPHVMYKNQIDNVVAWVHEQPKFTSGVACAMVADFPDGYSNMPYDLRCNTTVAAAKYVTLQRVKLNTTDNMLSFMELTALRYGAFACLCDCMMIVFVRKCMRAADQV